LSGQIKDTVEERFGMYDSRQRAAVESILDEWNSDEGDFIFPIVDGPPGTGKTSVGTIAAAKHLLENRHGQVAYLCYTHFAIERAQKDLFSYGFPKDKAVELHYDRKKTDWKRGIYGCDSELKCASFNDKRLLKECGVLLCTLHGSRRAFNHDIRTRPKILIDEFSQVSTPMFFSVLHKVFAEKNNPSGYALLGDPIQLPVISTQPTLRPNIGIFIMQRKPYEPHRLVIQHRMHEDICETVNSLREVYHAYRIENGSDVRDRNLSKLGYTFDQSANPTDLGDILDPEKPLVLINTDQCGPEGRIFGGSVMNPGESKLAAKIAVALHSSYKDQTSKPLEPWILSPYTAQVGDIRQRLPSSLRSNCITIYRSQGREYPCVIISFTRNNEEGNIGFLGGLDSELKERAREQTYVGCSRAQGKLLLLFSFKTFLGHGYPEFEALVNTENANVIDRL